jgi:excisionase family DNA binding protein
MENNNKDIFKNYPDVVTVEDLQNMLHIGRNTAYGILKDGAIKTIKIGKKYIIPKQSVIEFINVARI